MAWSKLQPGGTILFLDPNEESRYVREREAFNEASSFTSRGDFIFSTSAGEPLLRITEWNEIFYAEPLPANEIHIYGRGLAKQSDQLEALRKKVGLPSTEPVAKAATPTRRTATAGSRYATPARKGTAAYRAIQRRRADFVSEAGLNRPAPPAPEPEPALDIEQLVTRVATEVSRVTRQATIFPASELTKHDAEDQRAQATKQRKVEKETERTVAFLGKALGDAVLDAGWYVAQTEGDGCYLLPRDGAGLSSELLDQIERASWKTTVMNDGEYIALQRDLKQPDAEVDAILAEYAELL